MLSPTYTRSCRLPFPKVIPAFQTSAILTAIVSQKRRTVGAPADREAMTALFARLTRPVAKQSYPPSAACEMGPCGATHYEKWRRYLVKAISGANSFRPYLLL